MWLSSWLGLYRQQRLRRAADRLERTFAGSQQGGKSLQRTVRCYGTALHLAMEVDGAAAFRLFRDYDSSMPSEHYALAFSSRDASWLAGRVRRGERDTVAVALELAVRLDLPEVQRDARDRLVDVLGGDGDADKLVSHLRRSQELGLLDATTMTRALQVYLVNAPLERDAHLWSAFFDHLPDGQLPELCEVHCFLDRGQDAVRLADSPACKRQALACCARSMHLVDVQAGIDLARSIGSDDALRELEEHAGNLILAREEYERALAHFHNAGRLDMVSQCHEHLGQYAEALAFCSTDQPERIVRLVRLCQPAIDALVEQHEFIEAARQSTELARYLEQAKFDAEASAIRAAVAAGGRQHFHSLLQRAESPTQRRQVLTSWSRFEEESGELLPAAQHAEEGGDLYRAHRLYNRAGAFGEAARVLQNDDTPEGRIARAESRQSGGDLLGAARLYADAARHDLAVELFISIGEFAAAADCLLQWHGDDARNALGDRRLVECLRRSGRIEELARLGLRTGAAAGDLLRGLRYDPALSPALMSEIDRVLAEIDGPARSLFEDRATTWVAKARADVDRRFAQVWGLDLGTTTCVAAVYDTQEQDVVLCPWKGRPFFASTLSLDRQGNELVGLEKEEIVADWLVGHVDTAKRAMGTRTVYRVQNYTYRPQEVVARLIRHARGLVEDFLEASVRERLGELACAELGQVPDEWLTWAGGQYDLRMDRPNVILTIPAYFHNNQKHATRDACKIAGVNPLRLLHEPTAACLASARERRLTGTVAVVDLGAGTLDVSAVEVEDAIHEVKQVSGDTHYGGKDFDAAIGRVLSTHLERRGITVPERSMTRRRLDIAAEHIKISLSSRQHADYVLRGFADDSDVTMELSRAELATLLAEPLAKLREICESFRESQQDRPDHLVLVGGPMLSPLVREVIEQAFGRMPTVVSDPRTVVARGAALQGAVLDGKLHECLLVDVTPLPLGIRVLDEEGSENMSTLVEANTSIPTRSSKIYTTVEENQQAVRIEIYNGPLADSALIGQFALEGIPPAPAGVPQVEVTFAIDENCVLDVTAHDKGTGQSKTIQVTDTTLLSPGEVNQMILRYQDQAEREAMRRQLRQLVEEAEADDGDTAWRELQQRLSVYHPAEAPTDLESQQMLAAIFNESNQIEVELLLVRDPLRDLVAKAREHLDQTFGDVAEARHLATELDRFLDRLRPHLAKLAAWNALLIRLAMAEPNPVHRFRSAHHAGDYARALAILQESAKPINSPEDIRRQLDCLAETGQVAWYGEVLSSYAERLGVPLLDPTQPKTFLEHVRSALVTVGSESIVGSGFLVSDRLIVTNRRLLGDDPSTIRVAEAKGSVEHAFFPDSRHVDAAVLRMAEPVTAARQPTPLLIGHPSMLRIGDRVWGLEPHHKGLRSGVVDRFESFPEQNLQLFKTGLRLPHYASGGPLFNDLGEAIGIFTLREGGAPEESAFAVSIDAILPLLATAGFQRP